MKKEKEWYCPKCKAEEAKNNLRKGYNMGKDTKTNGLFLKAGGYGITEDAPKGILVTGVDQEVTAITDSVFELKLTPGMFFSRSLLCDQPEKPAEIIIDMDNLKEDL